MKIIRIAKLTSFEEINAPSMCGRASGYGWQVEVPCKINLFLEIERKRPDNFHDLDTLMAAVSLTDTLQLIPIVESDDLQLEIEFARHSAQISPEQHSRMENNAGFTHLSTDAVTDPAWKIPSDSSNIVIKALERLRERLREQQDHSDSRIAAIEGLHVRIKKSIPAQAGLGGGSADAAAALVGGQLVWTGRYDHSLAMTLAEELGSDINFFLETAYRGTTLARCTGRGEIVESIGKELPLRFVMIHPPLGCSTKDIFSRLSWPMNGGSLRSIDDLLNQIDGTDAQLANEDEATKNSFHRRIANHLFNRLLEPARDENRWVRQLNEFLDRDPYVVGHSMSGSGSALFAILNYGITIKDDNEAEFLRRLFSIYPFRVYAVSAWREKSLNKQVEGWLNLN